MKKSLLVGLLLASLALRLWLAAGGGQDFWPDESRYGSAVLAADDIRQGQWSRAMTELFGHADHILFRPACLPAALLGQRAGAKAPFLVSCYLSLFSVGSIFLIWAVAIRAGASEEQALWSAFLGATANCLFFYSRHYLPYDIALFVLLWALWLALGAYSVRRSFTVGVTVGLGALIYNGYWLLGATVLVLYATMGDGGCRRLLARAAGEGAGLLLTAGAVIGLGAFLSAQLMVSMRSFAASVRQGDFFIGYKVVPEYLWYSERGVLLIWLVALAYAARSALRTRHVGRLAWWLGGMALVTAGLIVFSDIVPRFMVYGRLTRQLVPFVCLGAGSGISAFLWARQHLRRPLALFLVALLCALAAWNFATPLRMVFPDDFLQLARRAIARQPQTGFAFYQILYAESLWGKTIAREIPPHTDLLRLPNPMQFRPYQYEGFPLAQRDQMNSTDISMRVIRIPLQLSRADSNWDGFPGPVSMVARFSPRFWGESQPLVVSGESGRGDLLLVRFPDSKHVQFGLDHWGGPEILSQPIKIDFSKAHRLVLLAGSLVPPKGSHFYDSHPELSGLWDLLVASLDGQIVVNERADFFPSTPSTIYFGAAVIGGTSTQPNFMGKVSDFESAPIDELAGAIPFLAGREVQRGRSPDWRGAIGPLRMRFRMPPDAPGQAVGQPLVSFGGPGRNGVLFAVRERGDRLRIGYDRRGEPLRLSDPIAFSPGGIEVLDVCSGPMLPDSGAPIFVHSPGFEEMRNRLYVHLDGVRALELEDRFDTPGARQIALWSNAVSSSACAASFQGDIASVEAIGPENLLPLGSRLSDLLVNVEEGWGGSTGPIRLRLRFPADRAGRTEPLLTCGSRGASDIFGVRYEGGSGVRFFFEDSGGLKLESTPFNLAAGSDHDLLLGLGTLMPPAGAGVYREQPEFEQFRSIAALVVDGRPAIFTLCEPSARQPRDVFLGRDPLGAGSCTTQFQGSIESVTRASPIEFLEASHVDLLPARPGWSGYPGPLRFKVVFPAGGEGEGQPIVTTGYHGGGDFVFVQFGAHGTARIVQDHWGDKLFLSDSFQLAHGSEHEMILSFGALFPPEGDPIYGSQPKLLELRKMFIVELDGREIARAARASYPSPHERIILGGNYIGGSFAQSIFTGRISDLTPASIESVSR